MKEEEKCCGNCCWFYGEDTCGDGMCADTGMVYFGCNCGQNACGKFISRQQMRHHMAVLLQHNRWRRSDWYEPHIRSVDPVEVSEAIDFAFKYMKVFSKL